MSRRRCVFQVVLALLCGIHSLSIAYAADKTVSEAARQKVEQSPGIVIGEPVAENTDEDTTYFGVGCARWLFWTVGGLPQMGSTPTWEEINRAEARLKREDLRIGLEEASKLVRYLGINRVMTGTVTGGAQACTLTFRLHHAVIPLTPNDQPQLKEPGAPLVAKGTYEQIIEQLPGLAREIAVRSGIAEPKIPESVGANAATLVMIAKAQSQGNIEAEDRESFLRLGTEFPLANMMISLYDNNPPDLENAVTAQINAVRNFLIHSPGNMMGWAELNTPGEEQAEEYQKLLLRYQKQYPDNYQVARALVNWKQLQEDYAGAHEDAETAVACAPFNPYAHLLLADVISEQADSLRQGRFFSAMDKKEQATVRVLYPQWVEAALAAVNRDTTHSAAWLELSQAFAFNSNRGAADEALWKAIASDPDNVSAYSWGLQMYQPKWHKDDAKMWKLVQEIMADESRHLMLYDQIFEAFEASPNQRPNAVEVRAKTIAVLDKVLKEVPDDAELHFDLGKILLDDHLSPDTKGNLEDRAQKAARSQEHFERAVALESEYTEAYFHLGRLLLNGVKPDLKKAEAALARAAELEPKWDEPAAKLGELFARKEEYAASEKWWRRAIRISPGNGWYYSELAYVVLKQNRRDEAVKLAEQAKQLDGGNGPVFEELQKTESAPAAT